MAEGDENFMTQALALAKRGAGLVSPNPMVGAVLVNDGRIVGEGYHRFCLVKHAETLALEMAGPRAKGATLYCNLEPCSHHGRTPPCTDAVIDAGIARAVISISDPDPRVNGRGIEQLRAAGIAVEVGLAAGEARRLNEAYLKFITTGTPFVHAVITRFSESDTPSDWQPSAAFLEDAGRYDALVLGGQRESDRRVVHAAVSRERHRPIYIVGGGAAIGDVVEAAPENSYSISFVARTIGKTQARAVPLPYLSSVGLHHLLLFFETLRFDEREDRVTSVLVMPGVLTGPLPDGRRRIDKLTLVTRKGQAPAVAAESLRIDLAEASSRDAGTFIETTGYPRALKPS